eukprot:m.440741 g.440741  ORF g.440741 m.440741 type:complete len:385 (-) comp18556_c0_seq1:103-1257(-)
MRGTFAAAVAIAVLQLAAAQHHPDPFAGSGCDCESFCNYKCSINASEPTTITTYRMTPAGVLDMVNKNTGDPNGDTSFVLSRRTTAYECRHGNANSFYCDGMTQFDGDDSNSTDIVQEWEIQIDGQWGPYLYCNPVNASDPLGPWDCDVTIGGGGGGGTPITPPPQCAKTNFSVYNGVCWEGYEPKTVPAATAGDCCAAASQYGDSRFTFFESNQTCKLYRWAFNANHCDGGMAGMQERGPSQQTCNCSRVHQAVGRENLTVAMAGYESSHPAGGEWYSFPQQGECTGDMKIGDRNCTWKTVAVKRTIMAKCMYANLDANVVAHDPGCFSKCPQPKNVTSDCYLQCYTGATEQMTHDELVAPWGKAFGSTDPSQGGCPEAPSFL